MKPIWMLLPLPLLIFACRGNDLPAVTATPLATTVVISTPQIESQTQPSTATIAPTEGQPAQLPYASQLPTGQYEWRLLLQGLTRPVDLQSANDGTGRLFIVEKHGLIRIFHNGLLSPQPFLNIEDRVNEDGNEMGLLGLAFHPNFTQNGYFYVNYTGAGGHTRISRFTAKGDLADPNSEETLMVIEQPFENHNGGVLAFGPEGYLYIGVGDGGAAGDPYNNGQSLSTLLGKILRIDVDGASPYTIPTDNPFGTEVWAYGLRNPWRMSFDRQTGDLWIGDVGQGEWEEVNYLPAGLASGANFGWKIMEGNHSYDGPAQPGLLLPAAEYSHSNPYSGCSVTGGYVYRGSMPEWNGIYLYGDYCEGTIWGLTLSNGQWQSHTLFETDILITSFGEDEAGELYIVSDRGEVYILAKK